MVVRPKRSRNPLEERQRGSSQKGNPCGHIIPRIQGAMTIPRFGEKTIHVLTYEVYCRGVSGMLSSIIAPYGGFLSHRATPNLKTFKRIAHHKQSVRGYPYDLGKHHIPIFKITLKKIYRKNTIYQFKKRKYHRHVKNSHHIPGNFGTLW